MKDYEEKQDVQPRQDRKTLDRRQYLKKITASTVATGLVAGSAIKWEKPIISNVLLPAHADTTEPNPEPTPQPEPPPQPSDIRLKKDVELLGQTANGYNLYQFKYISDPEQADYVGLMAQDLMNVKPEAVVQMADGHYAVNYGELGLRMATLEQWNELGIDSVLKH